MQGQAETQIESSCPTPQREPEEDAACAAAAGSRCQRRRCVGGEVLESLGFLNLKSPTSFSRCPKETGNSPKPQAPAPPNTTQARSKSKSKAPDSPGLSPENPESSSKPCKRRKPRLSGCKPASPTRAQDKRVSRVEGSWFYPNPKP